MTLEKSISRLIFLILLLTPVLVTPGILDDIYLIKAIYVLILTSLILIKWLLYEKEKDIQLKNQNITVKLSFIYFGLLVVATFFSVNPLNSIVGYNNRWESLFLIGTYVFLLFFASQYYRLSDRNIDGLIIIALIIGVLSTIEFLGYLNFPPYIDKFSKALYRPFTTLGNPNYVGNYLTIIISLALHQFLTKSKVGYGVVAGLLYLVTLMTLTRGAWLGLIVSMTIILSYHFLKGQKSRVIQILLYFAVLTLIFDILVKGRIVLRFFSVFMEFFKITKSEELDSPIGSSRWLIWSTVISSIPNRPIFGVGISNIRYIFENSKQEAFIALLNRRVMFDRAHNELIHIAATTGVPSLIVYLGIFATMIRQAGRNLKDHPKMIVYIGIFAGYFVQSLFSSSVVSFSYFLWIFMGAAIFELKSEKITTYDVMAS